MKCKTCNQDMILKFLYKENSYPLFIRFFYECSDCGIIQFAKPNLNYNKIKQTENEFFTFSVDGGLFK